MIVITITPASQLHFLERMKTLNWLAATCKLHKNKAPRCTAQLTGTHYTVARASRGVKTEKVRDLGA